MTNEQRVLKAACDAITNVRMCKTINLELKDDSKLVAADTVMFETMLAITNHTQ